MLLDGRRLKWIVQPANLTKPKSSAKTDTAPSVIAVLPVYMLPASLTDFLSNLLSESIGILITVFFVDRLLKRREDRRWAPAKHLLEARLFKLTEQIIYGVIGIGEGHEAWGMLRVYYFGDYSVISYCNTEQIDSRYIYRIMLANCERSKLSGLGLDYRPFTDAQGKLNSILDTSSFLLDPEVIELLMKLYEELTSILKAKDEQDEAYGDLSALLNSATTALSVHSFLKTKANKVQYLQPPATH